MGTKILTESDRRAGVKLHATDKHGPVEHHAALVKLGDATRMLAEVRDAPSAKKLMDLAAAAEHYAKKAKLGQDAIGYAQGIKLDAEAMLGEYLRGTDRAGRGGDQRSGKERCLPTVGELLDMPAPAARKLASEAERLADLKDDHPDDFAQVKAGAMKLTQALRNAKRATLPTRIAALPAGKHRVIYADPPWKYGDDRGGLEKADTAAAAQYPTMSVQAICELEDGDGRSVRDLAAKDAVLFMWATFPLLDDALAVVREWGFEYKTAFVWDKQRSNIGNYHDARAELLLIATRGSCPIEIDTRPKQVQSIARGKHSAKPEEFRALIDEMYPSGPRVELFRRGDAPDGWKVWGNETNSTKDAA